MLKKLLILFLAGTPPSHSTPKSNGQFEYAEVAIIAVGPVPARRYTHSHKPTDKIPPILKNFPHASTPPSRLYFQATPTSKLQWKSLKVAFNSQSHFSQIKADTTHPLFITPRKQSAGAPYLTISRLLPRSKTLFILSQPNQQKLSWKVSPSVLPLRIHTTKPGHSRVILTNTTRSPLSFALNGKPLCTLLPQQSETLSFQPATPPHPKVTLTAKGLHPLQTTIEVSPDITQVYLFHSTSNSPKEKRGLSVVRMRYQTSPLDTKKALSEN